MKRILIFLFLFVIHFSFAQISPPAPSMPTESDRILIDELIKVSELENYFNNYCKYKIDQKAKEFNWSEQKREKVIESVNFEEYTNTIYNVFALNTKEDLENIIELIKKLNKKRNLPSSKLIITNLMMQKNLDGYIGTLLK